jgi:hypothetical protein
VPTPAEAKIIDEVTEKALVALRRPALELSAKDGEKPKLDIAHPDPGVGAVLLMKAIGTADYDFLEGFLHQLGNASSTGPTPDPQATNFALSVVKGLEPRDQIEAMLAAQMAAVHSASMTFARRLAQAQTLPQQDSAERTFNKLTRTFAAQMAALKDYRSKGEQKMTVQHVHVSDGGQAIVGNINSPALGGGASEKIQEQSHAIGYAPGIEMPCQIEADRLTMPGAGGSRS